MMSSGQIAQMMSQQNQAFAGAAQYSHMISQQMPPAYSGGIGGSPGFAQTPGGIPQQGGFSYGGGGYSPTSRVSGGIVAGMGGAAQFGLGAAGVAAGFGMAGKIGGAMLDPFVGGGAGWRMGGRMAAGAGFGRFGSGAMRVGMGVAGMLPAAGLMLGASHAIGSSVAGAQEQAQVERVLGQGSFMSGAAPGAGGFSGGGGFTRTQSKSVGDMMRGMQALPEMMTSMSELTRIMDKMGQMGVMQGSQNVQEFKTKFTQNIKLLKDMSKVMATSMEEALPMFGEIRRSGIYQTSDILKNAMNRQVVGGVTGMNQGQVNQVAQYGAQVSHARGGTLAGGSKHALRVAGQLGTAVKMGLLSEEQIMEHTGGVGGAEGIQQMSAEMVGLSHKMARSSLGMVTSVALGETEDGRFTGKMDEGLMKRFRGGEFSLRDLRRMAGKRRNRAGAMSYFTHKKAMQANLAAGMGVEGTTEMLRGALGSRGFDSPDAMRLMSQRFGMTERQTELLPLFQQMPDIQLEMQQRKGVEAKRIATEAFMKENYSWGSIKSKVGKRISAITTEPFKKFGADLRQGVGDMIEDFVDDITGRYEVEVTKGMAGLIQGALAGEKESSKRLMQLMDVSGFSAQLSAGKGGDFTPGRLGSLANLLTGTTTSGEKALASIKAIGGTTITGSSASLRSQGVQVLGGSGESFFDSVGAGGFKEGATPEEIAGASERYIAMGRGQDTDRLGKIHELMGQSQAGLRARADIGTMMQATSLKGMDAAGVLGAYGKGMRARTVGGAYGKAAMQAQFAQAGLGGVDDVEMALAFQESRGLGGGALSEAALTEGRRLQGFTGSGSKEDAAKRIKGRKRTLSRGLGDEWSGIEAALGEYGPSSGMDLLFGDLGGGRGGILTGTPDSSSFTMTQAQAEIFAADPAYAEDLIDGGGVMGGYTTDSAYFQSTDKRNRQAFASKVAQKLSRDRSSAGKGLKLSDHEMAFLEANQEKMSQSMDMTRSAEIIQKIALVGPDKIPSEDKEYLKNFGTGVKMSQKEAKAAMKLIEAQRNKSLTPEMRKQLRAQARDNGLVAMWETSETLIERGHELADSVGAAIDAIKGSGLDVSDASLNVMAAMKAQATALQTGEIQPLKYGDIADMIDAAPKEERELLLQTGGAGVRAAYGKGKRVRQLIGQAHRKGGGGRVELGEMFSPAALQAMEPTQRKAVMEAFGDDKILSGGKEAEGLVSFFQNDATAKTMIAAGVVSKNASANPADIAAQMGVFVQSTKDLASFVQDMANVVGAEPKNHVEK